MYILERQIVLPTTLEEAWEFFSTPKNLGRITPPKLGLKIQRAIEGCTFAGQIIEYSVQALPGWSTAWITEITHCQKPHYFVDEQRFGPYRFWHHLHRFEEAPEGIRVIDRVHYLLPRYPGAALLHRFYIRPQLERIFSYREEILRTLFQRKATT